MLPKQFVGWFWLRLNAYGFGSTAVFSIYESFTIANYILWSSAKTKYCTVQSKRFLVTKRTTDTQQPTYTVEMNTEQAQQRAIEELSLHSLTLIGLTDSIFLFFAYSIFRSLQGDFCQLLKLSNTRIMSLKTNGNRGKFTQTHFHPVSGIFPPPTLSMDIFGWTWNVMLNGKVHVECIGYSTWRHFCLLPYLSYSHSFSLTFVVWTTNKPVHTGFHSSESWVTLNNTLNPKKWVNLVFSCYLNILRLTKQNDRLHERNTLEKS